MLSYYDQSDVKFAIPFMKGEAKAKLKNVLADFGKGKVDEPINEDAII